MSLADLYQRLSKKIERHQTIQLSAEDLDLFVLCGAYEKLSQAAADEAKARAQARVDAREQAAAAGGVS